MYVPNNTALKYVRVKHIELQGDVDKSIIVDGDFNTPLLLVEMDRSRGQKINKDIVKPNNAIINWI